MKASIIITTYHRPEFLERAILSAQNQKTDFQFEVIVIDDNGVGTQFQKQTQTVIPKSDQIRYYPLTKNSGACVARNKGAEMALGEYLFFLDDDDEFLPNKLQLQISFLELNRADDGCLAAFKRIDQKGNDILAESNYPVIGDFRNFVVNGNFFTAMLCIRKSSFLKSGGFIDIPRFQDRFYMMNALKQGFTFAVLREQLHLMYEHTEDRITSKSVAKTKDSLSQINSWIGQYKSEFSASAWKDFQINDLRKIAVTSYNSTDKSIRISSAANYFKIFLKTGNIKDAVMIFKALIK